MPTLSTHDVGRLEIKVHAPPGPAFMLCTMPHASLRPSLLDRGARVVFDSEKPASVARAVQALCEMLLFRASNMMTMRAMRIH